MKNWKNTGVVVAVVAPLIATGLGAWSIHDGVQARPLTQINAVLADGLAVQAEVTSAWIAQGENEIARVTGKGAEKVTRGTEAGIAADNAWITETEVAVGDTWIAATTDVVGGLTVVELRTRIRECQELVDESSRIVNGEVLLTTWEIKNGEVRSSVTVSEAQNVADGLVDCSTYIENRIPVLGKALDQVKQEAGLNVATPSNTKARDALQASIDHATKVLDEARANAIDDTVRTRLQEAAEEARARLSEDLPNEYVSVEVNTASIAKVIADLEEATSVVISTRVDWQSTGDDGATRGQTQVNVDVQSSGTPQTNVDVQVNTPQNNNFSWSSSSSSGGGTGTSSGGNASYSYSYSGTGQPNVSGSVTSGETNVTWSNGQGSVVTNGGTNATWSNGQGSVVTNGGTTVDWSNGQGNVTTRSGTNISWGPGYSNGSVSYNGNNYEWNTSW